MARCRAFLFLVLWSIFARSASAIFLKAGRNVSKSSSRLAPSDLDSGLHDSKGDGHEKHHAAVAEDVLKKGRASSDAIAGKAGESGAAEAQHVFQRSQEGQQVEKKAQLAKEKMQHQCLTGKRIVFIGPSTTKSDYLALAYFAEYGSWPAQDVIAYGAGKVGPNPIHEGAVFSSGIPLPPEVTMPLPPKLGCQSPLPTNCETYMRYSNSLFNGRETCDCYEFGTWTAPTDTYNSTENRVYIKGDTMISYFQYFGDVVPPRGTFDLAPLLQQPPKPSQQMCPAGQFPGSWSWAYTLPDFLRHVVKHSKPTHVVISSAFWPINPQNTAFWNDVAAAGVESVQDSKGQIIWKTAPQQIHESLPYRYHSPRLDMTPFTQAGWQVFPAGQIIQNFQGAWPNNAVFYDFAHLRPAPQCHLLQALLASHVCPGMPLL